MENYIENYKKYNKLIFKYMGYDEDAYDKYSFEPHSYTIGIGYLMLLIHKINHTPVDGNQMRVLVSMKKTQTEVFIQGWYDISNPSGYVNIVHLKEDCLVDEKDENYKEEALRVSQRAIYNACVDFIVKIS